MKSPRPLSLITFSALTLAAWLCQGDGPAPAAPRAARWFTTRRPPAPRTPARAGVAGGSSTPTAPRTSKAACGCTKATGSRQPGRGVVSKGGYVANYADAAAALAPPVSQGKTPAAPLGNPDVAADLASSLEHGAIGGASHVAIDAHEAAHHDALAPVRDAGVGQNGSTCLGVLLPDGGGACRRCPTPREASAPKSGAAAEVSRAPASPGPLAPAPPPQSAFRGDALAYGAPEAAAGGALSQPNSNLWSTISTGADLTDRARGEDLVAAATAYRAGLQSDAASDQRLLSGRLPRGLPGRARLEPRTRAARAQHHLSTARGRHEHLARSQRARPVQQRLSQRQGQGRARPRVPQRAGRRRRRARGPEPVRGPARGARLGLGHQLDRRHRSSPARAPRPARPPTTR